MVTRPLRSAVLAPAIALLLAASTPVRAQIPALVNGWGSFGVGNTQFKTPVGIALDASGNVYVCDTNNLRVQKFTHGGQYLAQWPVSGANGLAVDAGGNVFVIGHSTLEKFTSTGSPITQWAPGLDGRGVAVGPAGEVYAILENTIRKYTNEGAFVLEWGGHGVVDGRFNVADGIAVDRDGFVYVVDHSGRIQKFTDTGAFIGKWGSLGDAPGQFEFPVRLAVDLNGYVYVVDHVACRVNRFTTDGTYVTRWGSPGSGIGEFANPIGVATDAAGDVFVCDTNNSRIQHFSFQTTGAAAVSWGAVKRRYRPEGAGPDAGRRAVP